MPSIKIFEQDLTRGGSATTNTNVVYVPGFMNKEAVDAKEAAPARTPTLCTTVKQFESYFGNKPAQLKENRVDKSYLYAKELIALGIPVLYESLNGLENEYASVEVSEVNMLNTLAATDETGVYAKLKDRGEYQFKYLTSGGYGNFQVKAKTIKTTEITPKIKPEITGSNTDKTFKNDTTITYSGDNKWNYSDGTNTSELIMETKATGTGTNTAKEYSIKTTSTNIDQVKFTILDKDNVTPTKGDKINLKIDDDGLIQSTSSITWAVRTTTETLETVTNQIANNMASITLSDIESGETTGRGDCIALIDHENNQNITLTGADSIHAQISSFAKGLTGAENCAAFTPWINTFFTQYTSDDKKSISMPPSFAYLTALAKSLRTNASWLAVAGATRGQIPNIDADRPLNIKGTLTNSIAESYQNRNAISINAITNIKPFGYRIWGNRTLKDNSLEKNLTATSFLNIKTMVCDVKKIVWDACRRYMFEQNNDVLWLNFKSYIEPTLNQMKTGAGLSGYKIIKDTTDEKAKLVATIKLYPLYAVEDFEVTVQMLDDEISVS